MNADCIYTLNGKELTFTQFKAAVTEDATLRGKYLNAGSTADMPFSKDWSLQMFKRALADAVASGKEWIGWTVGKTQADRFSLAKQITALRWNNIDGNGKIIKIEVKRVGFSGWNDMGEHADTALPNLIGKEMADKIVAKARDGREFEEYTGLDLEVGGKGMKGFYDQILPKEIGKYVKQWGGKVEASSVLDPNGGISRKFPSKQAAEAWASDPANTGDSEFTVREGANAGEWIVWDDFAKRYYSDGKATPIHRIDITPAMKAGVESGQALFSSASIGGQGSFDFGTSSSFDTKKQLGFDFNAPANPAAAAPQAEAPPATPAASPAPAAKPVTASGQGALDLGVSVSSKDQGGFDFDAPAAPAAKPGELTDFGRTLAVRKNREATMREITDDQLGTLPFSKIWPKADVDAIEDPNLAALAHAVRSEVPRKPSSGYKVARWVAQVKQVREIMRLGQELGVDAVMQRMDSDSDALKAFANKVRILQQIPREHWDRIGSVANWPDAFRYEGDKSVPSPYATVMFDERRIRAESLDALVPAILEKLDVQPTAKTKAMQFEVRQSRATGKVFINKKGDSLYRHLKEFETTREAFDFIRENNAALVAEWEKVKDSDNVKEADLRTRKNRERAGTDRRQGGDVTDDMFRRDFGFSGVAFGNWVQQGSNSKERQGMFNLAYDALMDLADVLGVPPKALSLNGDLGLALGADGKGKYAAHYQPGDLFINLTKTRGAGTLAHEFFHALDHYFQRQRNTTGLKGNAGDYFTQSPETYYEATDGSRIAANRFEELIALRRIARPENWKKVEGVRPAVAEAFTEVVKALDASPMAKRSKLIDKGKSGYWGSIIERAARSFENYVIHKMHLKGYHNDYLANVTPIEEFPRDPGRYPYLLEEELGPVVEAFDNLFGTIQTKETDRGTALFSSPTQPDLFAATSAPDAAAKLGQVKIGTKNALGAYRALTAKRDAGKTLTPDEEQTLLDAEAALGQKMAFDMEAVATGKDSLPVQPPVQSTPPPPTKRQKDIQQSMSFGGEVLKDGQITLFSSPTPQQDAEYLAAVDAGDMAKAERMVEEAAMVAGYDIGPIHHGTLPSRGDFDVFRNGITAKDGFRLNFDGLGPGWFSSDKEQASKMGSRIISGYIRLKKPLTLYADEYALDEHIERRKEWMTLTKKDRDESGSDPVRGWFIDGLTWDERERLKELTKQGAGNEIARGDSFEALQRLGKEAQIEFPDLSEGEAIRRGLQAQGYDGIILEATNADSGNTPAARLWVVPFDGGNQIKSADPVTRDADSNVIPLSQRFNPGSDSILFSSATDTQAAVEAALEKMPPIYREVFQRVSNGASEADVMLRLGLTQNAITNILNAVRSRIVIATKAAAGTLNPDMRDGKFDGGRPDLAEGAQPDFVAVDQIRNESNIPGTYSRDDARTEAGRRLDANYEAEFDRLFQMIQEDRPPNDIDVAMAKEIFRREAMSGGLTDPARRTKVALFRVAYRDMGSAQSRAFSMRIDEEMTPAERNAMHFVELLYEPSPEVKARLKKADPATKESILKKWMQQIDAFKAEMKAQGIDIEATLREFNEREQARKQALDESPRAKAAMDDTFAKLSKREKMVVQMILNGGKASAVVAATGMPVAEIQAIFDTFQADWLATLRARTKQFLDGRLAASPADNMMARVMAEFGWQSWDDFDDLAPDYAEKQEVKKKEAQAIAQVRREAKKPKPKESPRFGTAEQEARWKELAEKWRNSPMSTWRTLWETVMNDLGPIFGTSFEKARDELLAPWRELWQTEMNLRPQDRMTFDEWMERPETRDKWKKQPELFAEPINETTGTSDARTTIGQGSLALEGINETTGTFDLNDPRPMSYLANEWARRNGTWINKAIEWFKMAILSGLQTIAINAMGGMHVAYTVGPRRAMEAAWNDLLGLFGAGDVRAATLTEFLPMLKNIRASMRLAAKQGIRSWQLESPVFESFAEGKPIQLEFSGVGPEFAPPALSVATWKELTGDPSFKNAIGFVNRFMRNITFRELTATDEFWKGMYSQLDVAAISHRIAAKEEKLTGDAYAARTAELMKPGSAAWSRVVPRTKSATFQDQLAYGKWTKEDEKKNPAHKAGTTMTWRQAFEKSETESAWTMIDGFAQLAMDARHMPLIGPILHMFALPFIITPKNLVQRGLEVTPLGLVVDLIDGMRSFRRRIYSGKITAEESRRIAGELYNKARFIQLLTNQSIGLMAYMVLEEMSEGDDDDEYGRPLVTGTMPWTSTKKGERSNAEEVMPPQSFRIGNTIIPYKRFDPFSTIIASLVDMGNAVHRNGGEFNGQVVTDSLVSLKEQTKEKLFLKGIGDLIKVAENPERGADRLAAGYVTGFVPNFIRQPVRETDTVTRDKNPMADAGFFEAVAQRVGYDLMPRTAPPKIDIWGDPIPANRGELLAGSKALDSVFRILDPTNTTFGGKVRPISAWIYRYNMLQPDSSQRIGIDPYNDEITVTFPGEEKPRKIALTPAEVMEANQNIGRSALALLGEEWDWRTAGTPEALQQAERIKDVFTSLKRNETQRIKLRKLTEAIPAP